MKPNLLDAQLKTLRLKKGDVIVLMMEAKIADHQAKYIENLIAERFPGHRALLLDSGIKIGVIGKAGAKTIEKAIKPNYEKR